MNRLLFCAALTTTSAAPAAAPKPADTDPALTKAVVSAQEAYRTLDWKACAKLMHPDSLKDFRAILLPLLEKARKTNAGTAELLTLFDGAEDLDTVLGWKPEEFFERFMKATASKGPMKEIIASTKSTFLGAVREGNDVAHAVIRTSRKYGKVEIKRVEVVSLKKFGASWKITLGDEARGLAETIRISLGGGNVEKSSATDESEPDR